MGAGWPIACLVLAVMVRAEEERWSRPERRQGDWVPLTCANCRPSVDQGVQASDSLPSVLTPPPRAQEARLLPPPPPPDGLFQQAATGFLQAYTQQQPPRKHHQFLQETSQSINRPQAQFLKANGPLVNQKPSQHFLQEPSQEFQPPQEPRQNRQPQLFQYDQQFVSDQPYLNQPLLFGPQFLPAPFFPQTSIPPQNIQAISPVQLQPQNPISPNVLPVNNQNFQIPPNRPEFTQQITAQDFSNVPQQVAQTPVPQQFYSKNETDSQKNEDGKDEVQLLYVPVETLNQRAKGKLNTLISNQQVLPQQTNGANGERFLGQSVDSSTRNSVQESQSSFNIPTQTSKPLYNDKQTNQFQQQLPPIDQDKFNTQTSSLRQQFIKETDQLQQQPSFQNGVETLKAEQNIKQQYNFKTNNDFQLQSQYQPTFNNFNSQVNFQQTSQLQPQSTFENSRDVIPQTQNFQQFDVINQPQQAHTNFNGQNFNNNEQFRAQQEQFRNIFQQQLPLVEQPPSFKPQPVTNNQQFNTNQNVQFQQTLHNFRDQTYINQPVQTEQSLNYNQHQFQQHTSVEEVNSQTQFEIPEVKQQTSSPVVQTVTPASISNQDIKEQSYKSGQQDLRQLHQARNNEFLRKFPQDYQQSTTVSTSSSTARPLDGSTVPNTESVYNEQKNFNQQHYDARTKQFPIHHQQHQLNPVSSTLRPHQTTLAPNQPPLSVYMETTEESKVNDVLRLLKNAKTIQVLDTVGPDSPQVFVGPSNLKAPTGYIKFELPYLNSLDSNRVERKVDKLPFFVAPLNFNPPPGYSKIPFPAPHVGSVVVSNATVLRTALHDKPYETKTIPISSTEQYLNQYTLPDAISPISPQLPSLVNSLRDEIYSAPTTASSSTTTETTTVAYTTPTYRGRGPGRGSQRGSPSFTTSTTRRVQPRTRRPYSRRQPVTTTTTTEEPATEQSLTTVPEQQAFNSETYSIQNTITPPSINGEYHPHNIQQNNIKTYNNELFVANNFNENRFSSHQFTNQPLEVNDHYQSVTGRPHNEGHRDTVQTQNEQIVEPAVQPTLEPVSSPDFPPNDNVFKNQRPNVRRDPTRHHQRFRNRQRITTTTDVYEQPPPADSQFYTQTSSIDNQNNVPSHIGVHNQRLVENTHFQANVPINHHSIQTERADIGFQTTERLVSAQSEGENNQDKLNSNHNSQYSKDNTFEQTGFAQNLTPGQMLSHQQNENQFSQNPSPIGYGVENFRHSQINSEHQFFNHQIDESQLQNKPEVGQFQSLGSKEPSNQYDYLSHSRNIPNHLQHANINQHQQNKNYQFNNQQVYLSSAGQVDNVNQGQAQSTPAQLEQVSEVSDATTQDVYLQTTETTSSQPQVLEDPQPQLYNQQRLKYNRPVSRVPTAEDNPSNEFKRGHQTFHSNVDSSDSTTADDVTTKASLVRVRGRVRSRQRGSVRQSTTTEEPNYPTSYLNRQKLRNENANGQDYNTRKRVNFNNRPTYTTQRSIHRDSTSDQNVVENHDSTERQPISEGSIDYTELSTTTTESSVKEPTRKYQHILNRNKLRRVRPTNAPSSSGSSGTTRFLQPTTQPPITRLPNTTRGRIRKPVATKSITSTTEYSQDKPSWNERENFAPSAGSNEILEPLYQTKDRADLPFASEHHLQQKTSPKPGVESNDDEFWNHGVTIQQSTSFDFKPESVTPPSFKDNGESQGPFWNGQVELQDGNYYDAFNQRHVSRNDQTPFSSDQQEIIYKDIKSRRPVGKENQYTEKDEEQKNTENIGNGEENTAKVYPVYAEVTRPEESDEEQSSQAFGGEYDIDKNRYLKKNYEESSEHLQKKVVNEEDISSGTETELKEGALKRKIIATRPGKKGGRRRGSWVRVRVRKPTSDMFETAESQNLGRFSENTIQEVTKTTSEKAPWTPEPVTETVQTTTSEGVSDSAHTITFEQALKDMLKEFITNPDDSEDGNETETEASTDWPIQVEASNTTDGGKEDDEQKQLDGSFTDNEKFATQNLESIESKYVSDKITIKQDVATEVTTAPEITTEVFTQEPITVFPTIEIEGAQTTVEPEVTTVPSEEIKQPQSRVLGTSTTTEISLETEICYRGRCVKTKKLGSDSDSTNSDLLTME